MNHLKLLLNQDYTKDIDYTYHPYNGLFELRTMIYSTPRQTYATQNIVEVFNPLTDIFVGINRHLVDDFKERLDTAGELTSIDYLTLNSTNMKHFVGNGRNSYKKRVFIDCSSASMLDVGSHRKLVTRTMLMIDEFFASNCNKKDLFYILS